ncbi:hypothetical protein K505DRAFT_380835 [Melanomma pulvis-pyrius CBS 109.77]|uniref:Uncharacterized protein n=1 Tax=Melanomma pulvis-pyrius CBS 109.77 TaxID=1314802 RepID=A0A6A6WNL1_9PLEO|nr:hypothetical protein K505DRAFT_380835 [Melanomma pulvis-pyrius CBS 109.77]
MTTSHPQAGAGASSAWLVSWGDETTTHTPLQAALHCLGDELGDETTMGSYHPQAAAMIAASTAWGVSWGDDDTYTPSSCPPPPGGKGDCIPPFKSVLVLVPVPVLLNAPLFSLQPLEPKCPGPLPSPPQLIRQAIRKVASRRPLTPPGSSSSAGEGKDDDGDDCKPLQVGAGAVECASLQPPAVGAQMPRVYSATICQLGGRSPQHYLSSNQASHHSRKYAKS